MGFLKKIWAVYGLLIFFLLWLVFLPFYYLAFVSFPRGWRKYIIWFSHQVYTRLYFGLTLVRFEIIGREHLDPKQTYIIVSNHRTVLDFMINARAYPGVFKFLAKKELTKVPVFGFIVRKLCVLVDRSDRASRLASMKFLQKTMAEGYSVFLYPEGTRNRSNDPLLPFHSGAFRTAISAGHPIAVQTIIGANRISGEASGFSLCPGKVKVVWSKPVPVAGLTTDDLQKLSDQVQEIMVRNLAEKG